MNSPLVLAAEPQLVLQTTTALLVGTAIPAAGLPLGVSWAPVAGANRVEVERAGVTVSPAGGIAPAITLGTVTPAGGSSALDISVPGGAAPLRSLTLNGLRVTADGSTFDVRNPADLSSRQLRIAVALRRGSDWDAPVHTVPALARKNAVPPLLGGASLSNRVLILPDLVASSIRVTVVRGEDPAAFTAMPLTVTGVVVARASVPRDLALVDAGGATLWAFPGWHVRGAPAGDVDLRVPVELALQAAVDGAAAPATTFTLRTAAPGHAVVGQRSARGALLRVIEEAAIASTRDPARLPLPEGVPPLAAEQAAGVTADVVIRYAGVRRHPLSDPPLSAAAARAARGHVVAGVEPVRRALPPAGLLGEQVAAVGLAARALEDTELSVRLVDADTGAPLGDPGVLALSAADTFTTVWVELPAAAPIAGPVAVAVQATRGRLLWAGEPDPLLALAVVDPDPGGRSVHIGASAIPVTGDVVEEQGRALVPASFRSTPPMVESELWCQVVLRGLTLRYPR